jgi:hypothetical protein
MKPDNLDETSTCNPMLPTSAYGHFRRYTNLAATIHLLKTKTITLLNPATWDDRNDAFFMSEYKRLKGVKTVLALCFAQREETYHHWKVFSHGNDGVCIEFDKENLLTTFSAEPNTKTKNIDYELIKKLRDRVDVDIEELPFLKRYPYTDEAELRAVYVDTEHELESRDYEIEIGWIRRVNLSPWMPRALAKSVRTMLKSIPGCADLKVSQSTLIENEQWKEITARLTNQSSSQATRADKV